jgi:hypothetical protein
MKLREIILKVLVDTGSSRSIISTKQATKHAMNRQEIVMNGEVAATEGTQRITLDIDKMIIRLNCFVSKVLGNCDILLCMDGIRLLGVVVRGNDVQFLGRNVHKVGDDNFAAVGRSCSNLLVNDDQDLHAEFVDGRWVTSWKWNEGEPVLKNNAPLYRNPYDAQHARIEVDMWIK